MMDSGTEIDNGLLGSVPTVALSTKSGVPYCCSLGLVWLHEMLT